MKTKMKQLLTLLTLCFISINIQAQISNGLVAHYPFSGNAMDVVGTVDGTVSNATLISDRFGTANSAYSFTSSGSNRSFIDLGNNFNSILSGSGSKFSMSIWFKRADTIENMILFSKHANSVYCGSNDQQVSIHVNPDGSLRLNYHQNTTATNYDITTSQITDTLWHHLVVTYDGGIGIGQDRTNFYVDNSLWTTTLSNNGVDVNAIAGNAAHAAFGHALTATGTLCTTSNYGSDGGVDDVYIYNRILSPCDVDSLYALNNTLSINSSLTDLGVNLTLYPNPVEEVLYLKLESMALMNHELNVQIINITGQVLKSQSLQKEVTSIGTSQLATGVYFVRILDGRQTIATQKMIKY